jgi:hypothetical protein
MSRDESAENEFRAQGFSSRAINLLIARDIYSLRELANLTIRDLMIMPGVGPKTLDELKPYVQGAPQTTVVHNRPLSVTLVFDAACLTAIDAWGMERGMTSRAGAIRGLVELGLKAK